MGHLVREGRALIGNPAKRLFYLPISKKENSIAVKHFCNLASAASALVSEYLNELQKWARAAKRPRIRLLPNIRTSCADPVVGAFFMFTEREIAFEWK